LKIYAKYKSKKDIYVFLVDEKQEKHDITPKEEEGNCQY